MDATPVVSNEAVTNGLPSPDALPKELESTAVVRFQDCDPFRHLNNARYIDYFLNARDDQLNAFYNFNITVHGNQTNQAWVVTKTQIAYLAPAAMSETVVIRTRLIHATETGLVVEGIMFDRELKRVKSVIWMEFVYVSLATGRPTRHAADLMTFFIGVAVDGVYEPDGFNARLETIKQQFNRRASTVQVSEKEAV